MNAIGHDGAASYELVEPLVLRARREKRELEYRDTRETVRMRRCLREINEALASVELAHPILGPIRIGSPTRIGNANPGPAQQTVRRLFSGDFNRGGRFYGGFWIGMQGEQRIRLTINGSKVVEQDYRALHPTLLYAEAGASLAEDDPYDIAGYPRKLVKIAFNTMINARTRKGAAWSILQSARTHAREGTIPGGFDTILRVDNLVQAIEARHWPIARAFYSDAGIKLQRRDSDMAETVMFELARDGIVALPIHDSFIAAAQHSHRLEEAMEKSLEISRKRHGAPGHTSRHPSSSSNNEIRLRVSHGATVPQNGRGEAPTMTPPLHRFYLDPVVFWQAVRFLPPELCVMVILSLAETGISEAKEAA